MIEIAQPMLNKGAVGICGSPSGRAVEIDQLVAPEDISGQKLNAAALQERDAHLIPPNLRGLVG